MNFLGQYFPVRKKYSLENLQRLFKLIKKETDNHKAFKDVSEILCWGQNIPEIQTFIQTNPFPTQTINQTNLEYCISLLQCYNILLVNITNEFILDIVRRNSALLLKGSFRFENDEILGHFMALINSLANSLTDLEIDGKSLLLERTLQFVDHKDNHVRTKARTILLKLFNSPKYTKYIQDTDLASLTSPFLRKEGHHDLVDYLFFIGDLSSCEVEARKQLHKKFSQAVWPKLSLDLPKYIKEVTLFFLIIEDSVLLNSLMEVISDQVSRLLSALDIAVLFLFFSILENKGITNHYLVESGLFPVNLKNSRVLLDNLLAKSPSIKKSQTLSSKSLPESSDTEYYPQAAIRALIGYIESTDNDLEIFTSFLLLLKLVDYNLDLIKKLDKKNFYSTNMQRFMNVKPELLDVSLLKSHLIDEKAIPIQSIASGISFLLKQCSYASCDEFYKGT